MTDDIAMIVVIMSYAVIGSSFLLIGWLLLRRHMLQRWHQGVDRALYSAAATEAASPSLDRDAAQRAAYERLLRARK